VENDSEEAEFDGPELDGPLLEEILSDEDRDQIPGALPVVSVHENDELEYLKAIARRTTHRVVLTRRGEDHGSLVELEAERPEFSGRHLVKRWKNAEPILLPGLLTPELDSLAGSTADYQQLKSGQGLRDWLAAREARWGPEFELSDEAPLSPAEERDLETVRLNPRGEYADVNLWLKTGRLSTFDGDESLRLRISFGKEVEDDASTDLRGHAAASAFGNCLLPAARAVASNEMLARTLAKSFGGQAQCSQHIVYWNAPNGGARFHHDAFGEPDPSGQRGVVYAQLTGSTLWLALSARALAQNVATFAEMLADGELRHLRDTLFPGQELVDFITLARDETRAVAELALPGCGALGKVVDLGPEFTTLLADGGHAVLVKAGDVLLLPNHGYDRTAMHSVFCASAEPGEALSSALRKL